MRRNIQFKQKERKQVRLKGYNYSAGGYYFITACVKGRKCCLGHIADDGVKLSELGEVVKEQLLWVEKQYVYAEINEYIIMPNHFHLILALNVGNGRDRSLQKIKSASSLIGAFKTTSSKKIHKRGFPDFKWQKSFYDHIIRNEKSYIKIMEYIRNNPFKWHEDIENPAVKGKNSKDYYKNMIM